MKYKSTRGKVQGLSFKDVLFAGYAADGGLFVPEYIPKIDQELLKLWLETKPSYPTIVEEIVRLFVAKEEISNEVLSQCVKKAYANFKEPKIVAFSKICETSSGKRFKVAELFHGPTASFKDYALSLVGQFMKYFLAQKNEHVTILIGTSGDTGSAAIQAVQGLAGIDIIVLYPDGNISPVQELQMNSSVETNVHIFAVEGTSDNLDVPIKQCFPDDGLCSINSINWARIMIQICHFVYMYIQEGTQIDIFVPTGAAGNISAGVLASLMGIPIKLFIATNENDNVEAFFNKGELRIGGKIITTPANAMDIGTPYNLERIIYLLSDSSDVTCTLMERAEHDPAKIPDAILNKINSIVGGCRKISSERIFETIKNCWKKNGYIICPHTATALACYNDMNDSGETCSNGISIIIATASPSKFPEIIEQAGIPSKEWKGHQLYQDLIAGFQSVPDRSMIKGSDWLRILQNKISTINIMYNKLEQKKI